MDRRPTTLERAFELASAGRHRSVDEVKTRLKQEGFDITQITGRTLLSQLRAKIKQAAENTAGATPTRDVSARER